MRKQMFDRMEAQLHKTCKPEERMFAMHPDEEHIIVSHALFLLRKFEEEMLTAYLTESDEFPELLRYCNLLYETFPYELAVAARNSAITSKISKLQAIGIVAAGYGGDMDDDTVDEILDSLDFDFNNKVCCPVIERMLPQLNKIAERALMCES